MYWYIIIIFTLCWILHLIVSRYGVKKANIIILLILLPVCIFTMGFRDISVGVDTHSYKLFFDDYSHYSWNKIFTEKPTGDGDTVELGLKIMMKLCSEINSSYYFYQFIFSFIYVSLFFYFIYRYTSNIVLAIAIFLGGGLYMQPFNIARQMFAIVILAFSMMLILEKKYIKSLFLIGLAYLFHSSSLIALIMFIIYPFRNNKFLMGLAPIIMVITLLTIELFFLPLLMNLFGDKYLSYVISDYSRPNKGVILKIMWIFNFLLAIVSLYCYQGKLSIKFLAILTLIAVVCYIVGLSINYVDRIGLIFLPAILIMYDRLGVLIKNKRLRFIYLNGFTAFYIIYFVYFTYINESTMYKSII